MSAKIIRFPGANLAGEAPPPDQDESRDNIEASEALIGLVHAVKDMKGSGKPTCPASETRLALFDQYTNLAKTYSKPDTD